MSGFDQNRLVGDDICEADGTGGGVEAGLEAGGHESDGRGSLDEVPCGRGGRLGEDGDGGVMRSAVGSDGDVEDGVGDDLETGGLTVEVDRDSVSELLLGAGRRGES